MWDLRTNKCVQTIAQDDWPRADEAAPVSIAYDGTTKRLVTVMKKPYVWQHKLVMQDSAGHRSAVVKVIYNSAFFVVVSADDSAPLRPRTCHEHASPSLACPARQLCPSGVAWGHAGGVGFVDRVRSSPWSADMQVGA